MLQSRFFKQAPVISTAIKRQHPEGAAGKPPGDETNPLNPRTYA